MFRITRTNTFKALSKRCLASLPHGSPTPALVKVADSQIVLPLAAQPRYQHTVANMTMLEKMKWDMGLCGKLRVPKHHLLVSAFKLYVCCTDFIDFAELVKELDIPDSFTSWFIVLQLHLWLVYVKLAGMNKEGLLLKQNLYKNMWMDVERRLNTFQELLGSEKRAALQNYYSIMCSSILYYDEGLIGDDTLLANSLWVQLFGMDEKMDPRKLELMVEYVRKQAHHIDGQSEDLIMKPGYLSFLPLHGTQLDPGKQKRDLEVLNKLSC